MTEEEFDQLWDSGEDVDVYFSPFIQPARTSTNPTVVTTGPLLTSVPGLA